MKCHHPTSESGSRTRPQIETVLFDLDGTLLDTHLDLAGALNRVLGDQEQPPLPAETLRPFASKGAMAMICQAFGRRPEDDQAKLLLERMLGAYEENIAVHTRLFPGMDTVLERIDASGRRWGIVTNKPARLTDRLLNTLTLPSTPQVVVSGDTLNVKKPHPLPLLHACNYLQGNPANAIYIGDDERDAQAGKKAGMFTLAASWGYIPAGEDPHTWGADQVIDRAADILPWLPACLSSH